MCKSRSLAVVNYSLYSCYTPVVARAKAAGTETSQKRCASHMGVRLDLGRALLIWEAGKSHRPLDSEIN
jgi:hypothetical protein